MYQRTNICGIISLILGIQAIITTCLPPVSLIVAVVAIILGIIGLKQKERQKGQAIAGLCCATAAFTISIGILITYLATMGMMQSVSDTLGQMKYNW